MELSEIVKLKKTQHRHQPGISAQTGFPSPATHYLEPTIDLHQELIQHADATFFVRVASTAYTQFNIHEGAVLLIDRSVKATAKKLALVVIESEFSIVRISEVGQHDVTLWGVITYVINKAV